MSNLTASFSAGNAAQSDANFAYWVFNKAEKYYNRIYQICFNLYGAYNLARGLLPKSSMLQTAAKIVGNVGVVDIVFVGPRIFNDISSCLKATSPWRAVEAVIITAAESCNIAYLVGQVIQLLGCFPKDILSMASRFDYAYIPNQFIAFCQGVHEFTECEQLRNSFCTHFKRHNKACSLIERIENVKNGCLYVRNKAEKIRSVLYLSKQSELKERAERLLQRIQQADTNDLQLAKEGEKFLKIIQKRIDTRSTAQLISNITQAASTVLSCIFAFYPAIPNLLLFYATTTVASIALTIFDALIIEKNPFAPTSELPLIVSVREASLSATSLIRSWTD